MRGYAAITGTIFLVLIMLTFAITLGVSNLFTRINASNTVAKRIGFIVAQSCLEHARLQLSLDPDYAGNETINVGTNQCTIQPLEDMGDNKIIKIQSIVRKTTTNIKAVLNKDDLSTVAFEELNSF